MPFKKLTWHGTRYTAGEFNKSFKNPPVMPSYLSPAALKSVCPPTNAEGPSKQSLEIGPPTQYRSDRMTGTLVAGHLSNCKAEKIIDTSYNQATKYVRIKWSIQGPIIHSTNNIIFFTNKAIETLTHNPISGQPHQLNQEMESPQQSSSNLPWWKWNSQKQGTTGIHISWPLQMDPPIDQPRTPYSRTICSPWQHW